MPKDNKSKLPFDPSRCPKHDMMVKKTGRNYKCPRYADCGWELDLRGMPSGKYWDENKEKLDPEGIFAQRFEKSKTEVPPVEIDGKKYYKPPVHMLSRCPMHFEKGKGKTKTSLITRKNKQGKDVKMYICPEFRECGYVVSYVTHKPFGMAYEKLVKDHSRIVDDLPKQKGTSFFPKVIQDDLDQAKKGYTVNLVFNKSGKEKIITLDGNKFTDELLQALALEIGVTNPQVFRELYKQGFEMAPSTRPIGPKSDLGMQIMKSAGKKKIKKKRSNESLLKNFMLMLEGPSFEFDLAEMRRKNPAAFRAIMRHKTKGQGSFKTDGRYYMFLPNNATAPLFWGDPDPEERVIIDPDSGSVVGKKMTKPGGLGWHYFNEFDKVQKQNLEDAFGYILKSDRGPVRKIIPKGGSVGGSGESRNKKSIKRAEDEYEVTDRVAPRPAGTASASAHSDLVQADRAKRAKEPEWSQVADPDQLFIALRKAFSVAKQDNRYAKTVNNIVDELISRVDKLPDRIIQPLLRMMIQKGKEDPNYQATALKVIDALSAKNRKGVMSGKARAGLDDINPIVASKRARKEYIKFLWSNRDKETDFRILRELVPEIKKKFNVDKTIDDIRYDLRQIRMGKAPMLESFTSLMSMLISSM